MDCGGAGCVPPPPSTRKMVNGKVMVVAVLVLVGVVLFILCLHIYAKWFWRTHGAAAVAPRSTDATVLHNTTRTISPSVGLARAVVEALPTFSFSSEKEPLECAVCLEDFEHGERGRTLPKCGHAFHLECIDMWFHSHSTCPLCRVSAGGEEEKEEKAETIVEIPDDEQPVVGDVAAPFMAAMRQQRRLRAQLASPNHSLPRTGEEGAVEESAAVVDERVKEFETPLQVTIDAGSSNVASVLSPMARASASFRRLLSRGKSVVAPQEEADEGGSSSSTNPPSPRSPPNA